MKVILTKYTKIAIRMAWGDPPTIIYSNGTEVRTCEEITGGEK